MMETINFRVKRGSALQIGLVGIPYLEYLADASLDGTEQPSLQWRAVW
jgi:hypothetical protein